MTNDMSVEEIESTLRKKFKTDLFSKFAKAINQYDMLAAGDRVAVCISGGKDSMLMAKLFQELKRHNKFDFSLVFLVMDPGYTQENRLKLEENGKKLGIPLTIFESDIFETVQHVEKSPCYLCARMRRGHLYAKAKELNCNKIALAHHYDDVIETILMSVLFSGQMQTMMPKVRSKNFHGMELIRPMYLVREKDIISWTKFCGLDFLNCACKFTAENEQPEKEQSSMRKRVKNLIAQLQKENCQVESNIFSSVEKVNLSTLISYKDFDGIIHDFREKY